MASVRRIPDTIASTTSATCLPVHRALAVRAEVAGCSLNTAVEAILATATAAGDQAVKVPTRNG